jgi:hypothetical protein
MNRVVQLYPQAMGFLYVAFYHSQGYGVGIRPRLHTGLKSYPFDLNSVLLSYIAYPYPRKCLLITPIQGNVFVCFLAVGLHVTVFDPF